MVAQLVGLVLSGATYRHVVVALYGLTELNVPPVTLGAVKPLHALQLVAVLPSVA